jgi:RNA polymerase primary sigma factor
MPNKHYYREIQEIKLLTPEEERELIKRAQQGDKEARDKLVMANQRYVIKLARKFYMQLNGKVDFQELVHIGNLGLLKALNKFNLSKETRFLTYAGYWIYQTLAQEVDKFLKQENLIAVSLNTSNEEGDEIMDFIEDFSVPNPEQVIEANQNRKRIQEIVNQALNNRERYIITKVFGLDGTPPKKIKDIAEEMGVSRQRVSFIYNRALKKLRKILSQERLIS